MQKLKEGGSAMVVDRPDKEQVIFYRDPNLDLKVDEGEGGREERTCTCIEQVMFVCLSVCQTCRRCGAV